MIPHYHPDVTSATAPQPSTGLTLETLIAAAAKVPKCNDWRYYALNPKTYGQLVRDPEFRSDTGVMFGLEIHGKPGQVMPAWKFSDLETFRKYLSGELSETDLLERELGMVEPGKAQG